MTGEMRTSPRSAPPWGGRIRRILLPHSRLLSRPRVVLVWLVTCVALLSTSPGVLVAQTVAPPTSGAQLQRIDTELQRRMNAEPTRPLPVIVEMQPAAPPFPPQPNALLARRALALLTQYGQPVGGLALISSAAGFANAAGVTSISLDPQVAYIYFDSTVQASAYTESPGQLSTAYPATVHADRVWQQGTDGSGIGVAVLDSGINPDQDLTQPTNRIAAAANFAGDRGGVADAGGHGTHVAGIVGGNGYRSMGEYVGIAPGASVLDVRVLNRKGNGRISSVVRGIEWVLAHRTEYNIRLINLSLGMPARLAYQLDPLCAAVEIAWRRGVAVVVAAGNGGPARDTVDSPGIDPYAITVGATDDRGTVGPGDDFLNPFSAWGTPPGSTPKPDVVAPGRKVVSLRVLGSALDVAYPARVVTARTGASYFRLTGTSMATPAVAGAAALVLEQQPRLTPDQLKSVLTATTQPYGWASGTVLPDPSADGNGLIDVFAAVNSGPRPNIRQPYRHTSTLARTLYPILYGRPLVWKDPSYRGVAWTNLAWDNLAWDNLAWDNLAWDNLAWDNLAWDNLAWDNLAWDNLAWDNLAWDNLAWDAGKLD